MCPMQRERETKETIEAIALKCLRLRTLETRNSDDLDFHEHAVWQIREALNAAFAAGVEAATAKSSPLARSTNERIAP